MAYVYKHLRKDNNDVFYIGIGLSKNFKRAYSKCNRNNYWKNIVNKVDYIIEIIHTNITWEEACNIEIKLIKEYGRKDLNEGELVNMTNGGDGIVGLIQTDEHRRKNSEANKGRPKSTKHIEKFKNRIQSDETKRKISLKNKGRICTDETKRKISDKLKNKMIGDKNPFFGKEHTNKAKEQISNSLKGRKLSETTKNKISESNKGKTRIISEKSKIKMSISAKHRNIRPPSRKGTCWVTKNGVTKSIKINDLDFYIFDGWVRGRK